MSDAPVRLRSGDTVRIRAERWVVEQQSVHGDVCTLDVRGSDPGNAGQRARFLLPFEPLEPMPAAGRPRVVRPRECRRVARATLASATPAPDALRTAAAARFDLLPYQLEPALAVTGGHGCRVLIADAVGLGKTVQAGLIVAELLARNPNGRALIICPAGLRSQWEQELLERFGLAAVVLDSAGIARVASSYDASANPWSAAPLVITSIDFVKRPEVMRALEGLIWDALVFDESHNLASRSDRSTAAAALAWRARTVVLLSATPHSGDDVAFSRLVSLGDVGGRFPLLLFRRSRADAGIPVERRTRWLHVRPTAAETRMHAALVAYAQRVWRERACGDGGRLAMTVLLRRAASSAESLVRSLERRLVLVGDGRVTDGQLSLPWVTGETDDEPHESLSAPGLDDRHEERRLIEQVLSRARFAAIRESKVATLCRWIARVREPILIFTEFRDTLDRLQRVLAPRLGPGRIVELHGGLTRSEREMAARRFTAGDADVLLATDAASEGLNLHHRCRCVVNLEIPWNPVRLEQRIGRVDRIGQRRRVHALQLVACDTYELTTVRRLVERAAVAADALDGTTPAPEATADAILTGVELLNADTARAPILFRRVAASARAAQEGRRIEAARRLFSDSAPLAINPVVAALDGVARRFFVAFELTMSDAAGVPVWSTVLGCHEGIWALTKRPTPEEVRQAFDERIGRLHATVRIWDHVRPDAVATIRRAAALGEARERAIIAAVRLRHARIAADLLQPGLFDRRAERTVAAQSLVLEEALGRCHARLESLARLATLNRDPPALRFGVFVR